MGMSNWPRLAVTLYLTGHLHCIVFHALRRLGLAWPRSGWGNCRIRGVRWKPWRVSASWAVVVNGLGPLCGCPGMLTASTVSVELAVMQEQDEVGDGVDVVIGQVGLG